MLVIKDLNNITWFENRFLQYKPVYPCIYDACYDDAMIMQCMMMQCVCMITEYFIETSMIATGVS